MIPPPFLFEYGLERPRLTKEAWVTLAKTP